MNFWTPTFHSWGHDLEPEDMPWYLLYDYVEVFRYDHKTGDFNLHWRDDFDDLTTVAGTRQVEDSRQTLVSSTRQMPTPVPVTWSLRWNLRSITISH